MYSRVQKLPRVRGGSYIGLFLLSTVIRYGSCFEPWTGGTAIHTLELHILLLLYRSTSFDHFNCINRLFSFCKPKCGYKWSLKKLLVSLPTQYFALSLYG